MKKRKKKLKYFAEAQKSIGKKKSLAYKKKINIIRK